VSAQSWTWRILTAVFATVVAPVVALVAVVALNDLDLPGLMIVLVSAMALTLFELVRRVVKSRQTMKGSR
jgi:hypothetical protein